MKIGVLINAYNEAEWIEPVIKSITGYFDEIVVTEGAYQMAINVGATPRSTDGTIEMLEKFGSDITVLHENEFEQCYQLNKGLEVLKNRGVDWLMVIDADEVWSPSSLVVAKNHMKLGEKSGVYQYWVHFYNFMNSFDIYQDARLKRIFKITPGCRFIMRNENMEWPDHGKPVDTGRPVEYVRDLPQMIRVFHYSGIKPGKRWKLKQDYLMKRNGHSRFDKWKIDENGIQREEDSLKIFTGKHPLVVRETELYKLWEKDPDLLRQKLFEEGNN